MVLTPEEQASIEERFENLERRNTRLERLIRSGKAFTQNPLSLATDLDDIGSVKTFLEFEEQSADPADTPLPTIGRLYAKEDVSGSKPYWQSDSGDVYVLTRPETIVLKTSNETATSDTTLSDDAELLFAIGASETWVFEFFIIWRAHVDGDIKFTVTVPSGAAGDWVLSAQTGTAGDNPTYRGNVAFGTQISQIVDSTNQKRGAYIWGTVRNSTTAGNITLQWAQNSSSGTGTIVFADSWVRGTQVN